MNGDTLARLGLRAAAAAGARNPDAGLLADLAALEGAHAAFETARRNLYGPASRRVGSVAEADRALTEAARASVALQNRVAATPAQTPAGALEKLRHVMAEWGDGQGGTFMELPLSAIRDALAVGFGITVLRPEPAPRWGAAS